MAIDGCVVFIVYFLKVKTRIGRPSIQRFTATCRSDRRPQKRSHRSRRGARVLVLIISKVCIGLKLRGLRENTFGLREIVERHTTSRRRLTRLGDKYPCVRVTHRSRPAYPQLPAKLSLTYPFNRFHSFSLFCCPGIRYSPEY